ncbi:MAG: endopeptidase La [Candidatus Omnitrophica bacterium]|nr:endopeptidase La [Candidatus Omnitrophota bacterium]
MAILKKNNSLKKEIREVSGTKEIPLVPIRDMVIFPYMVLPLLVGRQRSVNAVEESLGTDGFVVIGFQNDPRVEEPQLENIYPVGIYAKVIQSLRESNGTMKILVESLERVHILQVVQGKKYFSCIMEKVKEEIFKDRETEALMRFVMDIVQKYLALNVQTPKEFYGTIIGIEDPERLSDTIAGYLPLKIKDKARLLETFNVKDRLKALIDVLNSEINVLEVQKEIQEKVVKKIEQTQKEYLLHEQLKTIQQELGKEATENPEIVQLAEKIKSAKMKPEAETKALDELTRLSKTMPMSPEATVIRTYLDWLISLPWIKYTEDNLDIKNAENILNEDHYGLEKPKERILEYLAVRKRTDSLKGPILCFVGPPGVGKTSLGKSIARCLGRKFVRVSLGGVRDEAEIRGHRRTYIGALPGRIMQSIKKSGVNNPVFLLDEVDKLGTDFRGDPSSALLEVLDPEQNFAFSDHYLEVEFDLSKVLFITTANTEFTIPSPLLDRMEVISLPGYSIWEKVEIAKNFLIPRLLTSHGLKEEEIRFAEPAIMKLIKDYTREAGVRNLERELANICRKTTREIVEGANKKFHITSQSVYSYIGPEKYSSFSIQEEPKIGVATGMAWTEYGGDILFTEIVLMKGKGNLILTGKLGDVMKESAQASLSFVRANVDKFGISPDFYEKMDIHIHVPEGAIPKDGPSAGVTIVTAIVSALSKKYVRNDVAMTGEITLQGRVLKIGGLKSKILAAHRSGIKTVIIPKENENDMDEIPKKIRQELEVVSVSNIFEVLDKAMVQ